MDLRAATDYHATLLKRLHRKDPFFDRLWWIPALGVSAYFAFETIAGACFGTLIGFGICAILSTLDGVTKVIWHAEYLRHLHEHTDEADEGQKLFEADKAIDNAVRRWWLR